MPMANSVYKGSSNIHIGPASIYQNHMVPSYNSKDVTNSNLGHGNGQFTILGDGPENNPYVFTGKAVVPHEFTNFSNLTELNMFNARNFYDTTPKITMHPW